MILRSFPVVNPSTLQSLRQAAASARLRSAVDCLATWSVLPVTSANALALHCYGGFQGDMLLAIAVFLRAETKTYLFGVAVDPKSPPILARFSGALISTLREGNHLAVIAPALYLAPAWRAALQEHGFEAENPLYLRLRLSALTLQSETALPVVISYLRCPAPAHLDAGEFPAGYRLEGWQTPEVNRYRALYRAVGESWFWYARLRMPPSELEAILQNPQNLVLRLFHNDKVVGYSELDRRSHPEVALAYFGLLPEYTGSGLGKLLMRATLAIAQRWQPDSLTVNTCTLDHPHALGFYQKAGFQLIRREFLWLEDPRKEGLVDQRYLPHLPWLKL